MKGQCSYIRVFAAACLGMLLFGISITSLGAVLPSLINTWNLDILEAGSLSSLLPFGILAGSLIFGPVADRYGYRMLFIICSILVIIALEGIAFATELHILQVAFFVIGFGGGALNGGTSALVAGISSSAPGRSSANLSLLGVFYGLGALGIPALLALLPSGISYQAKLGYTGLALVLPVLYFFFIKFPAAKQSEAMPLRAIFALAKDPVLILVGLFLFFESAVEGVISNWTTTFLQMGKNFTSAASLLGLSIYVLSLTLTRLLLAALLRKFRSDRIIILSLVIILCGLIAIMVFPGTIAAMTGIILLGIGTAGVFPVMLGYVGGFFSEQKGTAFSIVFFIAVTGNILVNYLTGVFSRQYGMGSFPVILLVCTGFLALLLTIILRRFHNRTFRNR